MQTATVAVASGSSMAPSPAAARNMASDQDEGDTIEEAMDISSVLTY